MIDIKFAGEILDQLQEKNPRFHGKAYLFLLSSLHRVMGDLKAPRHITGQELANGFRCLALDRFGPMARTVLQHWGIQTTQDLGEIVFALVECGVLIRQDEDNLEDFQDLFDFEEAFEHDYPWST